MTVFSSHLKEFLRPQKSCGVCSKECNAACTRCWTAFYCSTLCQNTDWAEHRLTCKPVKRGSLRGRHPMLMLNLDINNNNNNNNTTPTDVEVVADVEVATDVDL